MFPTPQPVVPHLNVPVQLLAASVLRYTIFQLNSLFVTPTEYNVCVLFQVSQSLTVLVDSDSDDEHTYITQKGIHKKVSLLIHMFYLFP